MAKALHPTNLALVLSGFMLWSIPTLPAAAPAPGCADAITVVIDRDSMSASSAQRPSPGRLADLRARASAAFRASADEQCRRSPLFASALRPIRRLLIQSGAGATEATFYPGGRNQGATLVFQWIFVEAGFAVPGRADISLGLRCWAAPQRRECADRGD